MHILCGPTCGHRLWPFGERILPSLARTDALVAYLGEGNLVLESIFASISRSPLISSRAWWLLWAYTKDKGIDCASKAIDVALSLMGEEVNESVAGD